MPAKEETALAWREEQQQAFEQVRHCLSETPVLACPNFEIPFVLQTDASNTGLGAVLSQLVEENECVISYASLTLSVTNFPEKFPTWKIQDGKLYHYHPNPLLEGVVEDLDVWKLVPSDEERGVVLREAHDDPQSALLGVQKTYMRIATRYFWPRCYRDVPVNYPGFFTVLQEGHRVEKKAREVQSTVLLRDMPTDEEIMRQIIRKYDLVPCRNLSTRTIGM